MENWNKVYRTMEFSIDTDTPSLVVTKGYKVASLPANFRVLDLGCGNGRNAAYSAKIGGVVDAVDIAAIKTVRNADRHIKERISFHHMSVMDFVIQADTYDMIIATRLIQYLSRKEVALLFKRMSKGLTNKGLCMINYTEVGGIFDKKNIDVEKHHHTIQWVKEELEKNGLEIAWLKQGDKVSKYVPYETPTQTYDIIVRRKKVPKI